MNGKGGERVGQGRKRMDRWKDERLGRRKGGIEKKY